MKTKVAVVVSGGMVQEIYTDSPDVELLILDQDVMEEDGANDLILKDKDGDQFRARAEQPVPEVRKRLVRSWFKASE